jgi:hypothetical protein
MFCRGGGGGGWSGLDWPSVVENCAGAPDFHVDDFFSGEKCVNTGNGESVFESVWYALRSPLDGGICS